MKRLSGTGESVLTFETDFPHPLGRKGIRIYFFFFKSLPRSVIIDKATAGPPGQWVASGLVIVGSWVAAVESYALKKKVD